MIAVSAVLEEDEAWPRAQLDVEGRPAALASPGVHSTSGIDAEVFAGHLAAQVHSGAWDHAVLLLVEGLSEPRGGSHLSLGCATCCWCLYRHTTRCWCLGRASLCLCHPRVCGLQVLVTGALLLEYPCTAGTLECRHFHVLVRLGPRPAAGVPAVGV